MLPPICLECGSAPLKPKTWDPLPFLVSRSPPLCSGEKGTLTHGSVVNGRFEGFIKTQQGVFYVEPTERYLKRQDAAFHSVIYHEDDIRESASQQRLHYTLWESY